MEKENLRSKLLYKQVVKIEDDSITLKDNDGNEYVLQLDLDNGDCCGYANFDIISYEENSKSNPIITNIEFGHEYEDEGYHNEEGVKITFFGEHKEIASINAKAGSGSGWGYGACVTIECKGLDIKDTLISY